MLILTFIAAYLVGAFPTGALLAARRGIDLATTGSGNVGATNVSRALGKRAGVITLLLDAGKGALAVALAGILGVSDTSAAVAAAGAVSGHCFSLPPFLKGGKGVATTLGVLLILSPLNALAAMGIFGTTLFVSKMVSLASVTAALLTPIVLLLQNAPEPHTAALMYIGLLVTIRHRSNLQRISEGREPKIALHSAGGQTSH